MKKESPFVFYSFFSPSVRRPSVSVHVCGSESQEQNIKQRRPNTHTQDGKRGNNHGTEYSTALLQDWIKLERMRLYNHILETYGVLYGDILMFTEKYNEYLLRRRKQDTVIDKEV